MPGGGRLAGAWAAGPPGDDCPAPWSSGAGGYLATTRFMAEHGMLHIILNPYSAGTEYTQCFCTIDYKLQRCLLLLGQAVFVEHLLRRWLALLLIMPTIHALWEVQRGVLGQTDASLLQHWRHLAVGGVLEEGVQQPQALCEHRTAFMYVRHSIYIYIYMTHSICCN